MNKTQSYAAGFLTATLTAYSLGLYHNTKKISENTKYQKLEQEFTKISKGPHSITQNEDGTLNVTTTYDYGGKINKIVEVRNKFAHDNGLKSRTWNVTGISTPTPLALNPFKWGNEINTSSIDDHFKETAKKAVGTERKYHN